MDQIENSSNYPMYQHPGKKIRCPFCNNKFFDFNQPIIFCKSCNQNIEGYIVQETNSTRDLNPLPIIEDSQINTDFNLHDIMNHSDLGTHFEDDLQYFYDDEDNFV